MKPTKWETIARKIVGKWGYEEKHWWGPIAKAIKKADIDAYARGLHDGQIYGRENAIIEFRRN